MATVYLVRHGRTSANQRGILAGRSQSTQLDAHGQRQAKHAGTMLRRVPIDMVVTSPLKRTRQTASILREQLPNMPRVKADERFVECDYGLWTGRALSELHDDPLWSTVQHQPSAVRFPEGEAMVDMQRRAIVGVRELNERFDSYVVVSHGDVIKSILADALGMHLDQFQRIVIDPGSVSVVTYTPHRPFVSGINLTNSLVGIAATRGDAVVGGRSR